MKHYPFLDKWNRTIESDGDEIHDIELKDIVERLALSGKLSYLNRILDLKDGYALIFNHNGEIEFKSSYSGDYVITSGKYTYKTPHLHYAIGALELLIENKMHNKILNKLRSAIKVNSNYDVSVEDWLEIINNWNYFINIFLPEEFYKLVFDCSYMTNLYSSIGMSAISLSITFKDEIFPSLYIKINKDGSISLTNTAGKTILLNLMKSTGVKDRFYNILTELSNK